MSHSLGGLWMHYCHDIRCPSGQKLVLFCKNLEEVVVVKMHRDRRG